MMECLAQRLDSTRNSNPDDVRKVRDGLNCFLQKETDCFFFVLSHPKRGEQSVGRDHYGATPGFSDTRIRTDDQRFNRRTERSGWPDSRSDPGPLNEGLGGAVDRRDDTESSRALSAKWQSEQAPLFEEFFRNPPLSFCSAQGSTERAQLDAFGRGAGYTGLRSLSGGSFGARDRAYGACFLSSGDERGGADRGSVDESYHGSAPSSGTGPRS